MKIKCKVCGHVEDCAQPTDAARLVTHVQKKHAKLGFDAINAIAPYLSTYFYNVVEAESVETYKETRSSLLQGFREWAKAMIVGKG